MKTKDFIYSIVLVLILVFIVQNTIGDPTGSNILFNESETKNASAAEYLNTSGGTFATLLLQAESQNLKWKAYAGNVSGVLTLDDEGDYSIYQWELESYNGRVFASRNSTIDWGSVVCAPVATVEAEQVLMNHTATAQDNINNTFNLKLHKGFYVGTKQITQNTCKSVFTWVNDTAQSTPDINSPFQELLLTDGNNLIYTTFVNDNVQGFNYKDYDFQMIVAEKGVGGYESTRYYFYIELE